MTNTMQQTKHFRRSQAMILHTRSGAHQLDIRLANTILTRFAGLMLSKSLAAGSGLLILDCHSVHTSFMRYAIDLIYLDGTGKVLKCVTALKPWRGSFSHTGKNAQGQRHAYATHTLELAAGTLARLAVVPGDFLECALWHAAPAPVLESATPTPGMTARRVRPQVAGMRGFCGFRARQRGASMIEFVVVAPAITLIGLAILQYGLLFFAKSQIDHASFMAARAGSVGNASLTSVKTAYAAALVPLYGGGQNVTEIAATLVKASADIATNSQIELLNPTKESFDKYNEPALQAALNTGSKKVIPNSNQTFKSQIVDPASGQTIQDANMLKLRITHGYEPKVPVVASIMKVYLKWLDPKTDTFHTTMVNAGRIPVVTSVTLQMQSDAIEPDNPVSNPGNGNNGNPTDPGDPPTVPTDPPVCTSTMNCGGDDTDPGGGGGSGGGGGGGGDGGGGSCPAPVITTLSADALFAFGKSALADLQPAGIAKLDALITYAKNSKPKSVDVTGFTDPIGSDAANLTLSKARAQTVRDYLVAHGFPAVPVNVAGAGATQLIKTLASCPVSGQAQIACLAPDRRVTVTLNP